MARYSFACRRRLPALPGDWLLIGEYPRVRTLVCPAGRDGEPLLNGVRTIVKPIEPTVGLGLRESVRLGELLDDFTALPHHPGASVRLRSPWSRPEN